MANEMEMNMTEHAGEVEERLLEISSKLSALGWQPIFRYQDFDEILELDTWHVLQAVMSGKIISREVVVIRNNQLQMGTPSIVAISQVDIVTSGKYLDDIYYLRFQLNGTIQLANFSPQVDADFHSSVPNDRYTLLAILRKDEILEPSKKGKTKAKSPRKAHPKKLLPLHVT